MKKLFLSLALVLVALTALADRSPKRGFGEDGLSYAADLKALAKGCSWWYNWGTQPPTALDEYIGSDKLIEYVPMTWNGGYRENELRAYYAAHPNDKYLLGFNEPNFKAQSNMTPSQAAQKWVGLENLASELGLTLVAPALNYPDGAINDGVVYQPTEWMDAFIAAYKSQNGGREPRMDYLALHCYMDDPQAMIDFVENFAKRYGKQVWLTEFCSWESQSITPESQMQDAIEKLRLLEQSDYVFRYAWFKARNSNTYPYYNLVEYPNRSKGITAGTLTDLGFVYVNMSTFNKDKYYGPGEVIPVGEFIAYENLQRIQWSIDPQSTDSVDIYMQGTGLSVSYQIDVPEAGDYKLILRASRPAGSSLKPRINILDGDGNTLVNKYTLNPADDEKTYVAYTLDVTLPAGKQVITIKKDNARAICLSRVKFVKDLDPEDEDLKTKTGTERETHQGGGTGDDDNNDEKEHGNWGNENVKVTDAETDPYQFKDGERYYAIYLDEQTRTANGISGDAYINLGDNGGSQNHYPWEGSMKYGDVVGENSFGITGNYMAFVVADKGWSGMGYSINAAEGDLDLSGINQDYSLHMAVKSESSATFNFYFTDGKGHVAKIILGDDYLVEVPQGAADQHKFIPIANFKRDGKWHNIDIPMSYLTAKFGLNFSADTDYDGNLFCINAGSEAGTDIAFDAVFFHGPADSTPDTSVNSYDIRITEAEAEPYHFSSSERYYMIYLDGNTKQGSLTEDQIVDCGPNGTNRQLYPWADTVDFPAASDENSFGVGSAYMNVVVGDKGWSGLGYFVGGSNKPLNLTGINDDYELHFAVKTEYTGMLEFELVDAMGNAGWIVLGDGTDFEGHKVMGNFPRDGKWYNIDVPIKKLANEWALNYSTATNFTGNLFCFLAGGVKGTTVGFDAVFIHGPKGDETEVEELTLDDRDIEITKVTDATRFQFPTDKEYDYYIIYMDGETLRENVPAEHRFDLGPNGSTRHVYPWGGTLDAGSTPDENSFGVGSAYMSWKSTGQGWLGLGYFIKQGSGVDLSGITDEYTLHFAVKTTSTVNYHYTVIDGNGKSCYLNIGPDNAWENGETIFPIGEIDRDGSWYNIDVPVSYLMKQGLDYRYCTNFRSGNIFNITAADNSQTGEVINGNTIPVEYDAIFFYGPAKTKTETGISTIDNATNASVSEASFGVYTLDGRKIKLSPKGGVGGGLPSGLYIVRDGEGTRKVIVP